MKIINKIYDKPIANEELKYLNNNTCLLDIETTGFSREANHIYMIGLARLEKNTVRITLLFADKRTEEKDILNEQAKINSADMVVFIYPDFWTASPAMLEGWFQRVWTYGFAYGDKTSMKTLEKAMFLITMGGSLKDEIRLQQLEAMKTVMVGDRIRNRAKKCEVYAFDEMTRGYGNGIHREERIEAFSQRAYDLAKGLHSI